MLKAFKYRLYPTAAQTVLLNKHIGCCRFVYNFFLEKKQAAWSDNETNINRFGLQKQLPDIKKEFEWLKEINAQSLQSAIKNLDTAFKRFFNGQSKHPSFKKKSNGGSFSVPQDVRFKNGKLVIPKFTEGIKIVLHRPIKGEIKQATISRTPTGKFFASILCEIGEAVKPKAPIVADTTIGIDLGIKSYIVTSEGQEFENPKFLRKAISKLKYTQRKYSKHKGKRTKKRLAILHEKVTNKRKDFLHKLTSELVKNHDSIAIENLDITKMLKTHYQALSISDAAWGYCTTFLKYKSEWYGKNILQIDRFDPSSMLHNNCGHINENLTLKDRKWLCPNCGELVLRDKNAAINIKEFALKKYLSVERRLKSQGELPALVGVLTLETRPPLAVG